MREYNVIIYREGLLGSIFLGESKVNPERFAGFLNEHAREGWEVVTMEREIRRTLVLFKREAYIVIMARSR
jgi:hypothetical protein